MRRLQRFRDRIWGVSRDVSSGPDKIQNVVEGVTEVTFTVTAAAESSKRQSPRLLLGDSVLILHLMLRYNLWHPPSFGSLNNSFFSSCSSSQVSFANIAKIIRSCFFTPIYIYVF